jgi:hypothetical protein
MPAGQDRLGYGIYTTDAEAAHLMVKHLVHRAKATRSRLKAQRQYQGPT